MMKRDLFYMLRNEYWTKMKEEKKTRLQEEIEGIYGSIPIKIISSRRLSEELIKILEKRIDRWVAENKDDEEVEGCAAAIKEELLK